MSVSNTATKGKQAGAADRGKWGRRLISLSTILLVIAITVALFIYRERVAELRGYGYLGAFLISLVANATIILPMPGLLILIALGAALNPFLVAVAGAAGGTLGEITGYALGRSGRGITSENKWYIRIEGWMKKKRGFLVIFLFALLPVLPLDVAGLVAGVSRYSIWKFFVACFLGKLILYFVIIQTGTWGWDALLRFFT
jgi:membrane protein YqaA with SNARE-associated domain